MTNDTWKAQIEADRRNKDAFFGQDWQSPISTEERAVFQGLDYYPADDRLRFELELHEHTDKRTTTMTFTKGEEREFIRWGEFRFQIDGRKCTLQAYRHDPDEEQLFVPLWDATSGNETYGAGRYLDLDPLANQTANGKWVVDFNAAYNPWCAYSDAYTCPVVPAENRLTVPVRAGEKSYLKPSASSGART